MGGSGRDGPDDRDPEVRKGEDPYLEGGDPEGGDPIDASWIEMVAPSESEGALSEVYAGIAGRSGRVANILGCQSLHPEGMRDHYQLYRTLMFGRGELSRAERESIAVVVSKVNGCHY